MNSDHKHEGGCLCGAIRYTITGPVGTTEYCHCSQCRKQSGAAAATWMDLNTSDLNWHGPEPKYYASSEFGRRGFCPDCGSTLVWRSARKQEEITLSITSLDDPNSAPPGRHIFVDDKLDWVSTDDDLEKFDNKGNKLS